MPTLDLHDIPVVADAWHRVIAPGGYECWRFDAEDRNADVRVIVTLCEGYPFHPGYLRRYARYRRWPRRVRPPMPAEYPCACVAVYEQGRLLARASTQYPTCEFDASDRNVDVRIGEGNRVYQEADQSYRVTASARGRRLEVELLFRPRSVEVPEQEVLARAWSGAKHRWIAAAPLCDVGGAVRLSGGAARRDVREIVVTGVGYHDHHFGTGPVGPGLRRLMRGRMLLNDRAVAFHFARPPHRRHGDEICVIESRSDGSEVVAIRHAAGEWGERTRREHLSYPGHLQFDHMLLLTNPRVIDTSLYELRLIYDARWRNQGGQALCEIVYPHRLTWPVLGRLIESSIEKGV